MIALIENIYLNNNTWIKDDLIKQNLVSQNNYLLTKRNIKEDLNIIKTIYKSKGFQNISVTSKVERYSKDRINLIYEITENKQQKISVIKFIGNNFYSDKFLSSIIESQSVKFYNLFKSGSNLNFSTFDFDKNKIISSYKNDGFFDVKVTYLLDKSTLNTNTLSFYIEEGNRTTIDNLEFNFSEKINNSLEKQIIELEKKLTKKNYYYDKALIDKYLEVFNNNLISNNIYNESVEVNLYQKQNYLLDLSFITLQKDPIVINKIEISGNSITKNKTIRSKILIQPGEYFNKYSLDRSIKILKSYPYINNINTETNIIDQKVNILIDVEENAKTGNVLVAGTFNAIRSWNCIRY